MKRFFKWFLILIALLISGVIGAYFLAKKYEEPVRNYIVGEVNKRLNSPVHVSDINFSLLARFPSASLVMDNVWAEENLIKIGDPDTLLYFRKVYLNLNILDIIDGQYKINEIEAKDGFISLLVDEKGFDNYHIWKTNEDTTGFLLELDKVHIENGRIAYLNKARQQDISLTANDLWFTGSFSKESYTMAVKGDGKVHEFKLKGTTYLSERFVAVESDLAIETISETYAFKRGRLLIDKVLDFNVDGKFVGSGVDLHIVGKDLDIIRSIALLPTESRSSLDNYKSSGILDFDCTLKGAFGRTENPRLTMAFAVENGSISRKGSKWEMTDLNGKGSLDNGANRSMSSTKLVLDELSGAFNDGPFQASFYVENFKQPHIDGSAKLQTDIQALNEFLDIDVLEEGSGNLVVDAHLSTTLLNPNESSARDFLNAKASGTIHVSKAKLKLKDDERKYSIDSASFAIMDNALEIRAYHGLVNQTSIDLNGRADHFLDYFFTDAGVLNVKGDIKVDNIDLQALFPSSGSESNAGSVIVAFPTRATWKLNIIADRFANGKFLAEEVSGLLTMNAFKAEATNLHFLSQGGQVTGRAGLYRFNDTQYGIKTDFEANKINVTQLFETFNNFEQSFITDQHLSGTADASVQFQAFCDSTINIDTKSIIATTKISISDGALVNFEPLISVADEVKKKPMLRLFVSTEELRKRLENVQFAELENEITIRNGVITIPKMDIRSSAIDINVSGTHSFDNEIDYAMDFALSELLELKDRKEPYNEYVQRDNTGRTRIYLTMIGTTDDFKIHLERTNVKSTVKDELNTEKNAVKQLLKDEFESIGNDSAEVEYEDKDLQIEFDPEAGSNTKAKNKETEDQPKPAEQEKNLFNKIIKKTETDKKKLKDGDFDDDDF